MKSPSNESSCLSSHVSSVPQKITQPLRLLLKRKGFERLTHGHPWILADHLRDSNGLPQWPGLVHIGEHWFFYSPRSQIRLRRFGPSTRLWLEPDSPTIDFRNHFSAPIKQLLHHRFTQKKKLVLNHNDSVCLRWIFSECDFIPGLIVDVFQNIIVCQLLSAPLEIFWPSIRSMIGEIAREEISPDSQIIEMRNSSVRSKEGLPTVAPPEEIQRIWLRWNDLDWHFQPAGSQKTGAYLDQKLNHKAAVHWATMLKCRTAWDLFCFEGGFGLHLAHHGLSVVAVDQSEVALNIAQQNARRNQIQNYQTQQADVFTWLRDRYDKAEQIDMIVLDPPGFLKSSDQKHQALKGYKELHLRAISQLKPGGLLVTCCCSQRIDRLLFYQMLTEAAHDVRRVLHILETRGPAPDHAPLLGFPESDYLQVWFLLVV